MAQVKHNAFATRNQKTAPFVGKSTGVGVRPATVTKRGALVDIGNEINVGRAAVSGKPIQKVAPFKKEDAVAPVASNNVSLRPRVPLRKAVNTTCVPEPVEDIDKDDKEDPFLMGEYVNDIYKYLREMELKYPIRENHMLGQCEVTSKMRFVLVDWLIEVQQQFHLLQETLYLTISITDRYLQEVKTVIRKKLQLVGVASMFVACKYEEMYTPALSDFVYICDDAYSVDEILTMEAHIVKTLKFSFSRPLPLHFLRRYSKASHAVMKHHQMAKYFLELSLLEYDLCYYPPSIIAAAAMFLALWIFRPDKAVWTRSLVHYSTYTYDDIEAIVKKLSRAVLKAESSKYKAVRTKYSNSKFLKVSCMPELKSECLKELAS